MSEFNYPIWIDIIFWSLPLIAYMWCLGIWANIKDTQSKEEKEEMTLVKALGTTLLCVFVGIIGVGGGSWYTTNKLFDPLIKDVKGITFNVQSVLREVKGFATKEELSIRLKSIGNSVREDISNDFNKKIEDVNERLLLLSHELMEVHMELEMELSNLENNTKTFINDKVTKSEEEVRKQFGEMYDKLDVLYKDLENLSGIIDSAKETLLGKYIIK
jgi:molecular chaperone DnaK (HSP70)